MELVLIVCWEIEWTGIRLVSISNSIIIIIIITIQIIEIWM